MQKIKNFFSLLSTVIVIGFSIGFAIAVYDVKINKYLDYNLLQLAVYTFQKYLNYYFLISLFAAVVLYIIYVLIARIFNKKFIGNFSRAEKIFHKVRWNAFFEFLYPKLSALALLGTSVLVILNICIFMYGKLYIQKKPNIIFISIDALRADHLGCYGYTRNTSPNLDSFAKENVIFEKAFVHHPWTCASHMSMLTSLYTITHGVYDWKQLNPAVVTLAEYLKNVGYSTLGFVNSFWLNPNIFSKEGFDVYVCPLEKGYSPKGTARDAEYQNKMIESYLKRQREENLFLFIHYYDVHSDTAESPYDAPPPYNTLFTAEYAKPSSAKHHKVWNSKGLALVNKKKIQLRPEEAQNIMSCYDNGIVYMDYCIGELFASLKKLNLYDNSMIIITADHGEEFLDHGYMLHDNPFLYDEIMHVPLIIKFPQTAQINTAKKINSLVELIDIMPSILDFLGIQYTNVEGTSFLSLMKGAGEEKKYVYGFRSTGSFFIRSQFIRSQNWKLLSDIGVDGIQYKLFNLDKDPKEKNDVVIEHPEKKDELLQEIKNKIFKSQTLRAQIMGDSNSTFSETHEMKNNNFKITEGEKEKLKSLGYLQ